MNGPCPVCASPFGAYVRDVPAVRTQTEVPLYACLECRSFWNPSDYVESDEQLRRDVDWGVSVADRDTRASRELLAKIEAAGYPVTSLCEIGCGVGTTVGVAEELGKVAIGFDTNEHAVAFGVARGLDLRAEEWTSRTDVEVRDLYLCVSVLERLPEPRGLLSELCSAAANDSAALFVSVPFLDRQRWDYLADPDPRRAGTPFFDNDVHVVHFSTEGLRAALAGFGAAEMTNLGAGPWGGVLASF